MLVLLGFVAVLAAIGLAAFLWGHDYTLEDWANGSYDARYNWNSYDLQVSETNTQEKSSKLPESAKSIPNNVTPKLTVKDLNLN